MYQQTEHNLNTDNAVLLHTQMSWDHISSRTTNQSLHQNNVSHDYTKTMIMSLEVYLYTTMRYINRRFTYLLTYLMSRQTHKHTHQWPQLNISTAKWTETYELFASNYYTSTCMLLTITEL